MGDHIFVLEIVDNKDLGLRLGLGFMIQVEVDGEFAIG